MPNATITNDQRAVFLNVSSTSSASYKRLGEGINTFTPSNNGQISTKHYINNKFATSRRNGLQKQFSFSGDRVVGDPANDYLMGLSEKTGSEVETSIIIADLTGQGPYAGKMYNVMIDVSNDGTIEGGQDVTIDGTFYVNGDPSDVSITVADDTATIVTTP